MTVGRKQKYLNDTHGDEHGYKGY